MLAGVGGLVRAGEQGTEGSRGASWPGGVCVRTCCWRAILALPEEGTVAGAAVQCMGACVFKLLMVL